MSDIICRYCFLLYLLIPTVQAADIEQAFPQVRDFFPSADRFAEPAGKPPAIAVYQGQELIGYVFQTNDVLKIPAYSGKPINMLVGVDGKGILTGVHVLEHHEPILLVGIQEQALTDFVNQYPGKSVTDRVRVGAGQREGHVGVDAITGATVTVMVMNEVIMRSARKVFQTRETRETATVAAPQPTATVRTDFFQPADWIELIGNQAIRRLHLKRGQVDQAFQGTDAETVDTAGPEQLNDTFIDLYYTYLNVPTIGRNLLGDPQYQWLMSELKPEEHAIAVLANGIYSFKGSSYVRGGIFDRVQLQQNDQAISFRDLDYHRLSDVYADGMPRFKEMAIFIVEERYAFAPTRAWQLELLVRRQTGPLDSVFTNFTGEYQLPDIYLNAPATPAAATPGTSVETGSAASVPTEAKADPPQAQTEPSQAQAEPAQAMPEDEEFEPIWVQVWRGRTFQLVCLGVGLLLLTLILVFQDWLTRHPRLLNPLRVGFLLYTVFFIGWYTLAQLSVVNVLTFVGAIIHDFKWDTFLIDPMIFILWSFVAMTLLLWGRGVYCGWLCPFGAIQELINKLARRFKIRQLELPFVVHERLWALKYLILLALFGISLQSLADAERAAEIEPFKTAITLRFQREWGFVLYAGVLLFISVFNRKFYCRYLCPLGAALAIPARIRLFDWLKRHKECGSPCQICANECEVQAIHPTGEINANECHYCLDCQVTYFNDRKCPPVIAKRKRREKASTARASVARIEKTLGTTSGLDKIGVKVEPKQR